MKRRNNLGIKTFATKRIDNKSAFPVTIKLIAYMLQCASAAFAIMRAWRIDTVRAAIHQRFQRAAFAAAGDARQITRRCQRDKYLGAVNNGDAIAASADSLNSRVRNFAGDSLRRASGASFMFS